VSVVNVSMATGVNVNFVGLLVATTGITRYSECVVCVVGVG
jgi:hypothetical protein